MYQNTTQVYDHNRQCPISIWRNFWVISFLTFFFKIFVGTNTALMLGLGTGEKTRKKKVKNTLFTLRLRLFFFSLFSYQVYEIKSSQIWWKKDKLSPSYDQTFIKRMNIFEIAFLFSSNDEFEYFYSSIRFLKIWIFSKTSWWNKPQTLSKVICQKAKMSTLIYEMEIHKVSRSKI